MLVVLPDVDQLDAFVVKEFGHLARRVVGSHARRW
jgi:hypothetical protein